MLDRKFDMGDMLEDNVTGFKGIVIAFAFYATGCIHYCLQPAMNSGEAKIPDTEWLDQSRLRLYQKSKVSFNVDFDNTGGPVDNPPNF